MTMTLSEIVVGLRDRPLMFVRNESYDTIVAFLDGYDLASERNALSGFTEWLALRAKGGANWHWSELALDLACPGIDRQAPLPAEADQRARECLFELLSEFVME